MRIQSRLPGALVLLLAGVAALILWRHSSVDLFKNDAAQYVSVSDTFAATGQLATTTLYYEVHHALGMPAAQTIWPPGFPFVIGYLQRLTGADSVDLIRTVNALAHFLSVILLFSILSRVCEQQWIAAFLAGCYAFHGFSLYLAATGVSEPLYTLCVLAVGLGISRAFDQDIKTGWLLLAACMAGLACLIRYQALVCALALSLSAYGVCLHRGARPLRSLLWVALALLPFSVVFAGLVLRNLTIAGSITGGPTAAEGQSLQQIIEQILRAAIQLLPGSLNPLSLGLSALLIAAIAVLIVQSIRTISSTGWSRSPRSAARLSLALYGSSLFAGTALLVALLSLKTTVYSFDPRYLVPTLPPLLAAITSVLTEARRGLSSTTDKLLGGAVAAGLLGLTIVNLLGWHAELDSTRDVKALRQIMNIETADGVNVGSLLKTSAQLAAPVMSNQSQLLYLVLRKPTLGVPERRLSLRRWSEADLHRLAQRFKVRYIVLFKNRPLGGQDGRNDYLLPFAQHRPAWTRSLRSTPDLELLEIAH